MKQKPDKNILSCTIRWTPTPPDIWADRFEFLPQTPLLQSLPYLSAVSKLNFQSIRYGVVEIDGCAAGLCAVLEASLLKRAVHAVMLDQGPVWFDGYDTEENFIAFLRAFREKFPKRFGRRVRLIPNCKNTDNVRNALREYGFKSQSEPYQTIWIDCRQNSDLLRAQLKKKWRNALSKAEQSGLDIVWSTGGRNLGWLVERYIEDRDKRGYAGASLKTLMALISEFSRGQNLMIGTAMLDGKPIASILILIHGKSATYQIGYSGSSGREKCANHLLLWDAMRELKEREIYDFDLGGINDSDAKGVRGFKVGMGGCIYESPGLWV
jgi:hypothetical protein